MRHNIIYPKISSTVIYTPNLPCIEPVNINTTKRHISGAVVTLFTVLLENLGDHISYIDNHHIPKEIIYRERGIYSLGVRSSTAQTNA